jgi:hypothetical protein
MPSGWVLATSATALRMLRYPVHRHRTPESSTASSSLWTALLSASEYQIGSRAPGQREPPLARPYLAGRLLLG